LDNPLGKARVRYKIKVGEFSPKLILEISILGAVRSKCQRPDQAHDDLLVGFITQGIQDTCTLAIEILKDFAIITRAHIHKN
jgi:hypothetical protein